jgi:carbon monoxide dehydrogenase subunit G
VTIKIELRETIAAPPEQVFETLTDLDKAGAWMQGLIQVEKLTQGPVGVGTRWREVRRFMLQKASDIFEVTAADPPRRIELFCDGRNGTSRDGHYRFTYTLAAVDSETELNLSLEITQLSSFGDLMGRLFAGAYKSLIAKEIRAMKSYVESAREAEAVAPLPPA